jgi:hypothetical protein
MEDLEYLATKYNTDKCVNCTYRSKHGYTAIYDPLLTHVRDSPIRMLEVGVCMEGTEGGQSVRMWYDYFTRADIFTFDIVDMSSLENDRVKFFRGDQSKREDLTEMYKKFGSEQFDYIIEDGSHEHHHQMISLGHLFQYVKSGGTYFLEDMSIPDHPACCIRNDNSFRVLKKYVETGEFDTDYILPEEKEYLKEHIKDIEVYADIQDAYCVAVITKK